VNCIDSKRDSVGVLHSLNYPDTAFKRFHHLRLRNRVCHCHLQDPRSVSISEVTHEAVARIINCLDLARRHRNSDVGRRSSAFAGFITNGTRN